MNAADWFRRKQMIALYFTDEQTLQTQISLGRESPGYLE